MSYYTILRKYRSDGKQYISRLVSIMMWTLKWIEMKILLVRNGIKLTGSKEFNDMVYAMQDSEISARAFKKIYNNKIGKRVCKTKTSIALHSSYDGHLGYDLRVLTTNNDTRYLFSDKGMCYTRLPVEVPLKGCW